MNRFVLALTAAALSLATLPAQASSAPEFRPLMTPRPSWFTDELKARVVAAGEHGVPLPDGVEVPTSGLAFTGIRPGAWMLLPAGCTMNFVFGTPGNYAIGTAGHCTTRNNEEVILVVVGPTSPEILLIHVGNTISTTGDAGPGNDFALVSIFSYFQSWVSPSMAHWGGPTAAYTGGPITPLVHSGHGLAIGTGGTPRNALGLYYDIKAGRETAYWVGATIFGDSGSAIETATGQAYANITHLVVNTKFPGADSAGTKISRILQLTGGRGLATCPTRTPWPLPGCAPV